MLRKLEAEYGWKIENQDGDVPKKRCRSQHLVGNRPRRYCNATIQRDASTKIQILEIELTSKIKKDGAEETESLSTLVFKSQDTTSLFHGILDELMTSYKSEGLNTVSWKRKYISQHTTVQEYPGHPENRVLSEQEALDSWAARAAENVIDM